MKRSFIRQFIRAGLFLWLIVSLAFPGIPAFSAGSDSPPDFASDHILVKFKTGVVADTQLQVYSKLDSSVIGGIDKLGIKAVKIPAGKVQDKLRAFRSESTVEFAEPDYVVKAFITPDDPYYSSQWGMAKINAPQAWDVTTGNSSIKIAILDTGVDQDHEDLAAKIVSSFNFSSSNTTDDLYGHGTHVAGLAAAITNNAIGIAGVGFNSSIMNVKVLDDSGTGLNSWVAGGIVWAVDHGAKVICMSLGSSAGDLTLENAVNYAWDQGVVVVAAAGNDANSAPSYPAYYSNCIAVAATDSNDLKAGFSTYGSWVDVAAPGVNILATLPNHANASGTLNYGNSSGTSMSAPHVAGLAALIWATGYGTSSTSVRNRIESTADQIFGTGNYWQFGRINAYSAVMPSGPQIAPSVTTDNATGITTAAARLNGNLTYLGIAGSANVSFQWGLSSGNYTAETPVQSANITGAFYSDLATLSPGTTYYFRAKAAGQVAGYGVEKTFATLTLAPSVTTDNPTNISTAAARLNGNLTYLGIAGSANVSFQWGHSSGNYTAETPVQAANVTGAFYSDLSALSPGSAYYYRAKAAGQGAAYGDEKSFTTAGLPVSSGGGSGGGSNGGSIGGGITGLSRSVTLAGKLVEDVIAESDDRKVRLDLPRNTIALNKTGQPLFAVTIKPLNLPPSAPADSSFIGLVYALGPGGATFNPPVPLKLSYVRSMLPAGVLEESLVIAAWDGSQWLVLPGVVDTSAQTYTVLVDHFTDFVILSRKIPLPASLPVPASVSASAVTPAPESVPVPAPGPVPAPAIPPAPVLTSAPGPALAPPANFIYLDLSVTPAAVTPGETVTISPTCANIGGSRGRATVPLTINGVQRDVMEVSLDPGAVAGVDFTVQEYLPGAYRVEIQGLTAFFTVRETPSAVTPPRGFPWWWAAAGFTVLAAIGLGIIIRRRSRWT